MFVRTFDTVASMELDAQALLQEHLSMCSSTPHAVMLTGGRAPAELYARLKRKPVKISDNLYLLISDERYVPLDSSESNFGKMRDMITALGLDDARVMRVHTELSLEKSADKYDQELTAYIKKGGRITLGMLGLGVDGHVASLFSSDDLERGKGRYAISVSRGNDPARVSVTADLLARAERIVFFVKGPDKADIVRRIRTGGETMIAARAVEGVSNVELWYSPDAVIQA